MIYFPNNVWPTVHIYISRSTKRGRNGKNVSYLYRSINLYIDFICFNSSTIYYLKLLNHSVQDNKIRKYCQCTNWSKFSWQYCIHIYSQHFKHQKTFCHQNYFPKAFLKMVPIIQIC